MSGRGGSPHSCLPPVCLWDLMLSCPARCHHLQPCPWHRVRHIVGAVHASWALCVCQDAQATASATALAGMQPAAPCSALPSRDGGDLSVSGGCLRRMCTCKDATESWTLGSGDRGWRGWHGAAGGQVLACLPGGKWSRLVTDDMWVTDGRRGHAGYSSCPGPCTSCAVKLLLRS